MKSSRQSARVLLCLFSVAGTPVLADIGATATAALLDTLAGDWAGTALRTPRGVLPYDICFKRTLPDRVAGVANPGAALHHWDFRLQDNALKLRFLTTFRGNTTPTWLTAESTAGNTTWFQADVPDHLRVGIETGPDQIDIHVLLHSKPHVDIRLLRRATHCTERMSPENIRDDVGI